MKISALRLFNVKRFAGRGVAIEDIGDGVNVLCAANEFGKSTSFEALHALFFQPHSGTPGAVQALRPYASGSPVVEADIATADGHYRITKQYYAGKSARVADLATGRLVAQQDEAENFIASLVRGGTAGPAGLLWVRQGITGIEQRSRSEEDREKQVRASLLESVQGEVEAVTGGRRMAEIMKRTQGALAELVTPTGRPKTGGRYELAVRERDALAEKEAKLGADVRALRDFLDRRAAAIKELTERDCEDKRGQQATAIANAEKDFEAAKAQGERLRAAEAELRLASDRHDDAERALMTFRTALATAAKLQADIAVAEQHGRDALARRNEAIEAIETARRDGDAAEKDERDARALLVRLEASLRAREAAERLAQLMETLEKAETAQQAIASIEAGLVHLKLPPKAVEELQLLEIEIARMQAVVEAARPSVAVAYEPGSSVRVSMDGSILNDDEARGYDARAELAVPGVGKIVLRSTRLADGGDAREESEARRRTLLAAMGVADLNAARERQVRAERAESEIRELKGRLSALAPDGLVKLRETVAAHLPTDQNSLELKGDPSELGTVILSAETRRGSARDAVRSAEPRRQRAADAFVEAQAALARLGAERAQVEAILGMEIERDARERDLTEKHRNARERLADAGADAERYRSRSVDLASVEATLQRLRSIAMSSAAAVQSLRDRLVELNAQIRARSDEAVEESWRESVEALEAANCRVAAFEHEVSVQQRLSSALESARSQARELYLKPVMAELKPLLELLFEDVSIVFDEKTLLPQTISRAGLQEDVERLSGGMREQLSVLTRLAFARLLARDGRPAPVILDDALVYSDDDRIEKMFDALHRQSIDQQIIVFSCRQRAFQRLGGNALRMTDWHP